MCSPAESFAHAPACKDRRMYAACSRQVQLHTTPPSLRMSRAVHALSVRMRIRTHAESCAHAPTFTWRRNACICQGACTGGDGDGSAGTSTPPPKKCAHGHAWYGLRVQGAFTSWSYFDALQRRRARRSTAVFRRLPCLQTRYIAESAADASLVAERPRAATGIR